MLGQLSWGRGRLGQLSWGRGMLGQLSWGRGRLGQLSWGRGMLGQLSCTRFEVSNGLPVRTFDHIPFLHGPQLGHEFLPGPPGCVL